MEPRTKELKAIAPKIFVESADWYSNMFQSLNAGATFILNGFPSFYRQTLGEMRGVFTAGELSMILDVLNGHGALLLSYMRAAELIGQHLQLSISDSFVLYPGVYEEKWGIDNSEAFIEKLGSLPRFSKVCLEIWAAGFWEQKESVDIMEYLKPLL